MHGAEDFAQLALARMVDQRVRQRDQDHVDHRGAQRRQVAAQLLDPARDAGTGARQERQHQVVGQADDQDQLEQEPRQAYPLACRSLSP